MSAFFRPSEFVCKCGECKDIPPALVTNVLELVSNLNRLREYLSKPIIVNSGVRCEKHNAAIGGKSNSQHLYGRAADIRVEGEPAERLAGFIEGLIAAHEIADGGLGTYHSFVHYDVGPARRWRG